MHLKDLAVNAYAGLRSVQPSTANSKNALMNYKLLTQEQMRAAWISPCRSAPFCPWARASHKPVSFITSGMRTEGAEESEEREAVAV
jgi:hypothetical protein